MKKIIILLLLVAAAAGTSCKKKTSSYSDSDSTTTVENTDYEEGETDERVYNSRASKSTGSDVDRLVSLLGKMGDELMANPDEAENISNRFEILGSTLNDNTPVSRSDIRRLNNTVMEMLEKTIYGSLVYQGQDPSELTSSQRDAIVNQLDHISRKMNQVTQSSTTLGEYMTILGDFMNSL